MKAAEGAQRHSWTFAKVTNPFNSPVVIMSAKRSLRVSVISSVVFFIADWSFNKKKAFLKTFSAFGGVFVGSFTFNVVWIQYNPLSKGISWLNKTYFDCRVYVISAISSVVLGFYSLCFNMKGMFLSFTVVGIFLSVINFGDDRSKFRPNGADYTNTPTTNSARRTPSELGER